MKKSRQDPNRLPAARKVILTSLHGTTAIETQHVSMQPASEKNSLATIPRTSLKMFQRILRSSKTMIMSKTTRELGEYLNAHPEVRNDWMANPQGFVKNMQQYGNSKHGQHKRHAGPHNHERK